MTQDPDIYRRLAALEKKVESLEGLAVPYPPVAVNYANPGQSIPDATTTIVNFSTKNYDPLNLVTTGAGWVFTAPYPGTYLVTTTILYDATSGFTAGEFIETSLRKNGALAYHFELFGQFVGGATPIYNTSRGAGMVRCAAGDTLQIITTHNMGASLNLFASEAYNWVWIALVQ